MCLKRPITASFERSVPFHLLRLMGVSVPSLHMESTDSMILKFQGRGRMGFNGGGKNGKHPKYKRPPLQMKTCFSRKSVIEP